MRRERSMRGQGGFSLIELLVTLAIIAVLIGVLLPALSQARSKVSELVGQGVPTDGLIGAWKMDEHYDGSHEVNVPFDSGTGEAYVKIVDAPELATSSAYFDGVNSELKIPTFDRTVTEATIAATIKAESWDTYAGIVFSREGGGQVQGLNFRSNGQLGYHWRDSGSTWGFSRGPALELDTWYVVGVSIRRSSPELAQADEAVLFARAIGDSETRTAVNTWNHPAARFNDLRIGYDENNNSRRFNGWIRNVYFYDKGLTDLEIEQLATGGQGAVGEYQSNVSTATERVKTMKNIQ